MVAAGTGPLVCLLDLFTVGFCMPAARQHGWSSLLMSAFHAEAWGCPVGCYMVLAVYRHASSSVSASRHGSMPPSPSPSCQCILKKHTQTHSRTLPLCRHRPAACASEAPSQASSYAGPLTSAITSSKALRALRDQQQPTRSDGTPAPSGGGGGGNGARLGPRDSQDSAGSSSQASETGVVNSPMVDRQQQQQKGAAMCSSCSNILFAATADTTCTMRLIDVCVCMLAHHRKTQQPCKYWGEACARVEQLCKPALL